MVSDTPLTEISKLVPHKTAFPALGCVKIKVDNVCQHWSFLFSLLELSPLQEVTVVVDCRIQHADIPGQVMTAMLRAELQRSVDISKTVRSLCGAVSFCVTKGFFYCYF